MINNSLKKTVSVLLTGAILLGFAACDFGGGKKAVIEAADSLASDMAAASASKLIKNSNLDKKSSEAEALTDLLDGSDYSDDQLAFFKAVEGTIEYEVDEESVKVNKGEATIDINFTIADYASVLKDDFTDIDSLVSAIKKADTKEITFTAEFVQVDKEWLCDNVGSKKFMKLYDYRNAEIQLEVTPEMIAALIDTSMSGFWLASNNVYYDTSLVEYDYFFDSAVYELAEREIYVYYKLVKDGSTLYESEQILLGASTNIPCRVDVTNLANPTQVFPAGSYTVQLLMADGQLIDSQTISVEVSPAPTSNPGGGGGSGSLSGEGVYFDFTDPTFRGYALDAGWYDYDNCLTGDYRYSSDVKTVAFSIQVSPDCNKKVNYFYAWTDQESSDAIRTALENPEYTNTVTPTQYDNGYFYDFDYTLNGAAKKGYYMLVVSDASTGGILMYAYCQVS